MRVYGELVDDTVHKPGETTYDKYVPKAEECFYATVLIANAETTRFNGLKRELSNAFIKGNNEYPITLTAGYELLLKYDSGGNKVPEIEHKDTEPLTDVDTDTDDDKDTSRTDPLDNETKKFI